MPTVPDGEVTAVMVCNMIFLEQLHIMQVAVAVAAKTPFKPLLVRAA
jgi:hypothetical protein